MKAHSLRSAFSHSRRSRGTVIMLVVAIMTLLMIIGTVFIFTTRTDRASARQNAEAYNFDMARVSALDIIRDRLFMQTAYPAPSAPNMAAAPYTQGAVLVRPPFWNTAAIYNQNDVVVGPDGRLFRCTVGHQPSSTQDPATFNNHAPPTNTTKWVAVAAPSAAVSSGWAEMRDVPNAAGWAAMNTFSNSSQNPGYMSNTFVVNDLIGPTGPMYAVTGGDFSILWAKRFNPSTGAYDIAYGTPPNASDISVVYADNANNIFTSDGVWHLMTYSSGNTRYRFAFRAVDTNRFLNLNVGDHRVPTAGNVDRTGTYLTGYQLTNSAGGSFNATDAGNAGRLHAGNGTLRGRNGNAAAFDFATWEGQCLGWEKWGTNSAANINSGTAEWFDFTDELEIRSFGPWGTQYLPRPTGNAVAAGQIWYSTLKNATTGSPPAPNLSRNYYTTYSFDRNIGPKVTAKFTLNSNDWPGGSGSTRMINLKAKTTTPADVARNAVYLANALAAAGYREDECLQAAVNYCGQSTAQQGQPPIIIPGVGLVMGGTTYAITGMTINRAIMAYYAQPYLNEVAVQRTASGSDPAEPITDFAVEMVNPHLASLDVTNWRIRVNGVTWVPNLQAAIGANFGGHAYNVIAHAGTAFTTALTPVPMNGFTPTDANTTITLERPYVDQGGAQQFMVVDQITFNPPAAGYTPSSGDTTTPRVFDKQRNNIATGFSTPTKSTAAPAIADHDWWMCTSPVNYAAETTIVGDANFVAAAGLVTPIAPSFGAANPVTGDGTRFGIELSDRFADGTSAPADLKLMRENVGDLCGYMLIGPQTDGTNNFPVTVTLQDPALLPLGIEASTQLLQETKARLNLIRDPRAQAVLTMCAAVDRASDGADQIGAGSADTIEETRIPGRININTAPLPVLRAVMDNYFTSAAGVVDTAKSIAACQAIIDYRNRTGSFAGFAPPGGGANSVGFKNIGELVIPMALAESNITVAGGVITVAANVSLDRLYSPVFFRRSSPDGARSANTDTPAGTWAKLFTTCTVRSDTFVIYGYVEAIKPATGHNNVGDWYTTTNETGGGPNTRLGFRRFVALVDRSWCNVPKSNSSFQMPRVIGVRELPK